MVISRRGALILLVIAAAAAGGVVVCGGVVETVGNEEQTGSRLVGSAWPPWKLLRGEEDNAAAPAEAAESGPLSYAIRMLSKRETESPGAGVSLLPVLTTYLETISKDGKDAMVVLQAAARNFGEIAFPPGENTTVVEAVANVVREVEATHKELNSMQIQDALLDSIKEQANRVFALGTATEEGAPEKDLAARITDLGEQVIKSSSERRKDDDPEKGISIALIVVGILAAILLLTNLFGLYHFCKQRAKVRVLRTTLADHRDCGVYLQEQKLLRANNDGSGVRKAEP